VPLRESNLTADNVYSVYICGNMASCVRKFIVAASFLKEKLKVTIPEESVSCFLHTLLQNLTPESSRTPAVEQTLPFSSSI